MSFKRILSIILSICIAFTVASFPAMAEETIGSTKDGLVYSVENGEVTITGYSYPDNAIALDPIIPAEIEGYPVTAIGEYAFSNCYALTSVVIPEGVTLIGKSAFSSCFSLTSINIPNSVTEIGSNAFSDCYGLASVTIPNGITSIADNTFSWCMSLTSVTIPDSVTSIGQKAFYRCSGLSSVIIGNGVISIGKEAFDNCEALISITIPNSVKTIDASAFSGCSSLETVVLGNGIETIEKDLFSDCFSLTSITIPDSVKTIGNSAFSGCSSIETAVLGNSVETIGLQAFRDCSSLTNITIPDSVTNINIDAFSGCSSLAEINVDDGNVKYVSIDGVLYELFDGVVRTLKKYPEGKEELTFDLPDSVWGVDAYAFSGNTYLMEINVSENNSFFCSQNGVLFNDISKVLLKYPAGKTDTAYVIPDGTKEIYFDAFGNCTSLTSVTIPTSVTTIWGGFENCTSLKSITIPDSVSGLGSNAFYGCTALETVVLGKGITTIGAFVFDNCDALTDVYYSGTEEQKAAISIGDFNDAFLNATWHYEATGCEHVYDNDNDIDCNECGEVRYFTYTVENDEVTISGYTGSASELEIPAEIEGYPVTKIADYTFYNNTVLVSVILPETLEEIGAYAFYGCTSLKGDVQILVWSVRSTPPANLTIPDSVTTIGEYAFGDCSSLETVILGVSVETIGSSAFSNCTALTTISIPKSVAEIGSKVFAGCDSLAEIKYEGTTSDKENIIFGEDNDDLHDSWQNTPAYISGDVNCDGVVNNKDLGVLRRFLNDWDVEIDELASDVNRDGAVNNKDLGILRRYLNDWDIELK